MKCDVCKRRFTILKWRVYRVVEPRSITGVLSTPDKTYNAIDCPECGCQHLLKVRLPEAEGGADDDD